jgi:RES domain-containing protein
MEFWRISNHADLSGFGGTRASGRWHTRGTPIVYLADHPASALLELLVRVDADLIPDTFSLLRVIVPDTLAVVSVTADALPADWQRQSAITRHIGDHWLAEGATAIMRVPSAIVPAAQNLLVNPRHLAASSYCGTNTSSVRQALGKDA